MPRKTTYRKEYCDKIVSWLAQGRTIVSFAAHIGCGAQRIYDWRNRHKEFKEAIEVAKAAHQAFYERLCLLHITGSIKVERDDNLKYLRYANPQMLRWYMSKRFKDYQETLLGGDDDEGKDVVYRSYIDEFGQIRNERIIDKKVEDF